MARPFILVILISLSTAFRPAFAPAFDGVSGTWKRTALTLVDASGKTSDMMQMMAKSMPCTKDITYTFSGDGRMKSTAPNACGALKKTIESMNAEAKWSMSGRKMTVTTMMKEIPTTTYDVSFQGNTMTWVFNFADNPKTPNPTKAKQMMTVYERI